MRTILMVIGGIVVVLVLGVCIAAIDEDQDKAGWGVVGMATVVAGDRDDGEENRSSRNKNGRDCRGSDDCSSFSPSFEDSPVRDSFNPTICLPFSRCGGSDEPDGYST